MLCQGMLALPWSCFPPADRSCGSWLQPHPRLSTGCIDLVAPPVMLVAGE